ncbi:hypothetical protein FVEN_g12670 [Fusarium venenatum]|nr:hypothetical protein FVEN_g12670 [Fusarium venenatum]
MAAPPVLKAIVPPRYMPFDRINHVSADNDQLFSLIEELEHHVDSATGFR